MGLALHLKADAFRVPPERRVLKADEYAALLDAHEIVEAAKRKADEIIAGAVEALEREKARGYEAGLAEANAKVADQILDVVGKSISYVAGFEEKMVDIVLESVRKVLGTFDDVELTARVVHNALSVVRNQRQVTLRVPPDQVGAIKSRLDEIMADYPAINFADVVADSRLKAGSCILESELGVVDASVDAQLEALRRAMVKSFRRGE